MVVLKPFRGWRYNLDEVGDPASVICPPYDLITPEIQESLRQRNPYNVVHLEAGEGLDWSAPAQGQYRRTASVFEEWTRKGVLQRDPEPSLYLSRQEFRHQGQEWSRLGLTACVGLEGYERRQVLPHEYTEAPAVRDRVSLMEACGTNFSPIMSLYRDAEDRLGAIWQRVMAEPPAWDVRDDADQRLTFWPITRPSDLTAISEFFQDTPVFLADGHHRYEAALQYREKQPGRALGSAQAYNFMMMTLIGFDDPGLLVLPYHRTLSGLTAEQLAEVQKGLFEIFEATPMTSIKESSDGELNAETIVAQVAAAGQDRHALAMVGLGQPAPQLLTLRPGVDWRQWGGLAVSEAWILEEQVLKPVLGEATLEHLGYTHDHAEAVDRVAPGDRQAAFLLKPFPMDQFEDIVGQGQRLPRKSTFFYPKLPTGLVINQLDGTL